ncbi:MAG: metallophosphoesterase [Armatimonadota bacterium]|nr:metallophosphoesterase [bacterium]
MRYVRAALIAAVLLAMAISVHADKGFFFVQLADTQLGFGDSNLTQDIASFHKAVEHINRLQPAFVIISGDLINSSHNPKQTREFWKVAREIKQDIPLYLVPGNHDIGQATAANVNSYIKLFGKDHYAFSCGGSEFIVLDSPVIYDSDSDQALRADQRKWFEDELATARKKNPEHIFVCTHHPWFFITVDEKDDYSNIPQDQRRDYLGLMKQYGVEFSFAGHFHQNAIAKDGSLQIVITSAVGRALGKDPLGLRIWKVYPDRVEHTYYSLDNVPEKISVK